MLALIELPEGVYVVVTHIVAISPRFEFETAVAGAALHMTSGEVITTDATVEDLLEQLAEIAKRLNP